MTDARSAILGKIAGRTTPRAPADIAAEAAALIADRPALRPDFGTTSLRARFTAKATSERVTASVETLGSMDAVPIAVREYLSRNHLPKQVALQPRAGLTELDWSGITCRSKPEMDENVALTLADKGVAETGSVVFLTAPDAPVLMNFLPLHHLVVLRETDLLAYPEDVFSWVGTDAPDQPRSLNIITGTSGTADIEAKNVRGAHGPRFMHIFLITGTSQNDAPSPAGEPVE